MDVAGQPDIVRCYYSAVDSWSMSSPPAMNDIGFATANHQADLSDPASWVDFPGNPLFRDGVLRRLDDLLVHEGRMYMFRSNPHAVEVVTSPASDGVAWSAPVPLLSPSEPGEYHVGQASLVYEGGLWVMIYCSRLAASPGVCTGFRVATSASLVAPFVKLPGEVMSAGDSLEVGIYEWHHARWVGVDGRSSPIKSAGAKLVMAYEAIGADGRYRVHVASADSAFGPWRKSPYKFCPSDLPGVWDAEHVATPAFHDVAGSYWLSAQGLPLVNPNNRGWTSGFFKVDGTPRSYL